MFRNTVTAGIVLLGQSNWKLWIFVVKQIAEAGDVWEYIDCQHGTPVHKVHVNCISHVTLCYLLTHLGCVYNRSL
jgi:hypothetical protein